MNRYTKSMLIIRLSLWGSLAIVAVCTVFTTIYAEHRVQQLSLNRFDNAVDIQQTHILDRMERYSDLLYESRAFLVANTNTSQEAWDTFMREQNAFERYSGISTIVYLKFFGNDEKQNFLQQMQAQPSFGGESFTIRPEGVRDKYAVARFVSSENDVSNSFGFDVYSGKVRRQAMDTAVDTGKPQSTPSYKFATGFRGFAAFLPVYKSGNLDGFSLLSFRINDFVAALFKDDELGLRYKITDAASANGSQDLYHSSDWQDEADGLKRSDVLDVLGRQWKITFAADNQSNVSWQMRLLPIAVLAVGAMVIAFLIIALRFTNRSLSR